MNNLPIITSFNIFQLDFRYSYYYNSGSSISIYFPRYINTGDEIFKNVDFPSYCSTTSIPNLDFNNNLYNNYKLIIIKSSFSLYKKDDKITGISFHKKQKKKVYNLINKLLDLNPDYKEEIEKLKKRL